MTLGKKGYKRLSDEKLDCKGIFRFYGWGNINVKVKG